MKTVKELLIDTSSSMNETLPGNKRKMDLAKDILIDKILPYISAADHVGIRLFGGSCSMVGGLQNIPNANFNTLRDFILNDIPEPRGSTPLALAIRTAVDNLKRETHAEKEIYLVTDGEETCGGNVKEAADYAASNGIHCKIHIISIGQITDTARAQFEYITARTGGKNISIGTRSTSKDRIAAEMAELFETDLAGFSDQLDREFIGQREYLMRSEIRTIRDFVEIKNLPVNYIPSNAGATCQKLLVVEFYNDDAGLDNLLRALKHVEHCGQRNKELLILMKSWEEAYYGTYFKPWLKKFQKLGVDRFCIKLDGFKGFKEL